MGNPPAGETAVCPPVVRAVFSPTYIKAVLLKAAQGQLQHPKHKLTDWTNGAFYAGVFAA
ncbi:MAG: hypothetical protein H7Z72_07315, partial [Bacteroidetes bacterium]|nr:hypothetical protein [Fibrella sp.]